MLVLCYLSAKECVLFTNQLQSIQIALHRELLIKVTFIKQKYASFLSNYTL